MNNKYIAPSGFYENLPKQQIVEERLKGKMQRIYQSWGYGPIETPAVEYLETLSSKGEISTEIYAISRAAGEGDSQEAARGLRYDLTVPFSRYVGQHFNDLRFPFKRYQIQKVWRGERPQKGRFREFYQADIDIIAQENLPLYFDAEMITIADEVLNSFNIGKFTIHFNNRKFLQGWLEAIGVNKEKIEQALRLIDKIDKIGQPKVLDALEKEFGLSSADINRFLTLLHNEVRLPELESFLNQIAATNDLLEEGKNELTYVTGLLKNVVSKDGKIVFNPKIARGLDYYTGSVFEITIDGFEKYGSIGSGGRYANLAEKFTKRKLPGVGISIGLSRLFEIIKNEKLLPMESNTVTAVMVGLFFEEQRETANRIAAVLRKAGINTEVNHSAQGKIGKQFEHASKMGIGHFLLLEEDQTYTLKNLHTGKQENLLDIDQIIERVNGDRLNLLT